MILSYTDDIISPSGKLYTSLDKEILPGIE